MQLPPPFKPASDHVHVIIETPRDSPAKYAFDQETGLFKLMKVLSVGLAFPLNFGFIPGTRAADGDPLDVLVLTEHNLAVGCLVECRLIGVIQAEQQDKGKDSQRNDRLVAVPLVSHEYETVQTIDELGPQWVDDLTQFFVYYRSRSGSSFTPIGNCGPDVAINWVRQQLS